MLNRLVVAALLFASGVASADEYVNGYVKKDGTYVAPYRRTDSNGTKNDNYSTTGNVNPYTGQKGDKPRDDYFAPKKEEPSTTKVKW